MRITKELVNLRLLYKSVTHNTITIIYLIFIPQREDAEQTPRGSIKIISSSNELSTFHFTIEYPRFWKPKNALLCGWVGGDFLKIVNKNYIKSYDKVKIKIWKI